LFDSAGALRASEVRRARRRLRQSSELGFSCREVSQRAECLNPPGAPFFGEATVRELALMFFQQP
jgi:hypothetical protein